MNESNTDRLMRQLGERYQAGDLNEEQAKQFRVMLEKHVVEKSKRDVPRDIPSDLDPNATPGPNQQPMGVVDEARARAASTGQEEVFPPSSVLGQQDRESARDPSMDGVTDFVGQVGVGANRSLGLPATDRMEPGLAAAGAEMIGASGTFLAGGIGAGALATRALQAVPAAVQRMPGYFKTLEGYYRSVMHSPVRTTAAEAAAAFMAGVGGEVVRQGGGSEGEAFLGELAGGLAPTAAGAAGRFVWNLPTAQLGRTFISDLANRNRPLIENPVARRQARDRLERAGVTATQGMDEAPALAGVAGTLTIGEKTGNPAILSLQRDVLNQADILRNQGDQRWAEVNESLRTNFAVPGEDGQASQGTLEDAVQYIRQLTDTAIEIARTQLTDEVAALGVTGEALNRSILSSAAYGRLREAEKSLRRQENDLWEHFVTPHQDTAVGKLDNTVTAYRGYLDELSRSRPNERDTTIPDTLRKNLGYYKKSEAGKPEWVEGDVGANASLREMADLRKILLQQVAEEGAKDAPNRERMRLLNNLQSSILDDIGQFGDISEGYTLAREFSFYVNERFSRGVISDVLGRTRDRGTALEPSLTLEKLIGGTGRLAGRRTEENYRTLMSATQNDETMREYVSTFVRNEFVNQAYTGGKVDLGRAETFMRGRADLLDSIPELRDQLRQVITSGERLAVAQGNIDPARAAAGIFLGGDVDNAARRILLTRDPAVAADLMRNLSNGGGEVAMMGFRQAMMDDLLNRALSGEREVDLNSRRWVLGSKLFDEVSRGRGVLREVLSPKQMLHLDELVGTAISLERGRGAQASVEGVLPVRQNFIIRALQDISFAGVGHTIGKNLGMVGNIQAPAIVVRAGRMLNEAGINPARRLLADAVLSNDASLLRSILGYREGLQYAGTSGFEIPVGSPEYKVLSAWAWETAITHGFDLSEAAAEDAARPVRGEAADIKAATQ